jgi:hypothetical protein
MPASHLWRILALFGLGLGLGGQLGCARGRGADAPVESLASYSPEAAVLFDDVLAPAVFGFDTEARDPASDPHLKERTRQAEFVVPARVETVSRVGGVKHSGSYEVTVAVTGPALVGDVEGTPLVLTVPATNPSYAWVDGAGVKWLGTRMLVFVRHYRDGNASALHFRCEPDTPAMRGAVQRAAALRLLR